MSKPFILNDESRKTSHGFYLLNSGGEFERFDANPVMLDNHHMDRLAGKWLNRRIEGSRLIADPDFDVGCAVGAERKGQADRGYLNGASLGIEILRAEMIGDDFYVTQWDAFEASVTPLPSNAGSLQLTIYDHNGHAIPEGEIRSHVENIVRLSAEPNITNQITPKMSNPTTIQLTAAALTTLGASEQTDSAALSSAIVCLAAERDRYKTLHETNVKKNADNLVNLAIKDGKIDASKREIFVKLALSDFETAQSTLDSIPVKKSLSAQVDVIGTQSGIPTDRKGWTLLKWMREDGAELNRIREEEPETYEKIKAVK